METYYPHQYPTLWEADPQTRMTLATRPEKYYAFLLYQRENSLLDLKSLTQELQRLNCYLMTYAYTSESVLSDFSQFLIASHFGILDTTILPPIRDWVFGAYAGLNRPTFLFQKKENEWTFPFGSFSPALSFSYESFDDLLRQWRPSLPAFFRNLGAVHGFEMSLERFLEQALKKLNVEQLRILKYLLILDKNPYTEEEIVAPLRNYSERCLDIFLSDWSELLVSLGLLKKREVEAKYGGMTIQYYFSDIHVPHLRKLLFHARYFEPFDL